MYDDNINKIIVHKLRKSRQEIIIDYYLRLDTKLHIYPEDRSIYRIECIHGAIAHLKMLYKKNNDLLNNTDYNYDLHKEMSVISRLISLLENELDTLQLYLRSYY